MYFSGPQESEFSTATVYPAGAHCPSFIIHFIFLLCPVTRCVIYLDILLEMDIRDSRVLAVIV